jgi:hypothetical protein
MNHHPKHDIAYSMLALDEPYARRLITELKKRLQGEQYLYSRKTEDAAQDSALLDTISRIFSADARLVVLLYRPGWGATPFTAAEQAAIQTRRLSESGDRSIFVVAMQPPHVPEWHPEHEFWADADVYSVPQISAMIEFALARERGPVTPETPRRTEDRVQEPEPLVRRGDLHEEEGSARTAAEVEKLFAALTVEAAEVTRAGPMRAACEVTSTACTVTYNQTTLQLKLTRTTPTPYVYAVLTAWVNVSHETRESLPFGEWRLAQILNESDEWMWQFDDALLTSKQAARTLMERLVEIAQEDRSNPQIAERSIKPPLTQATHAQSFSAP